MISLIRAKWPEAARRPAATGGSQIGEALLFPPAANVVAFPGGTVKIIVLALAATALLAWATPAVALIAGLAVALSTGNPLPKWSHHFSKKLLQASVVMLGFGMNLPTILRAGWHGSSFAALTIAATLLLGYSVGRFLNLGRNTALLISAGTAICGGSAIAAVGSVIAVAEGEMAVAMGTVFLLNAVGLYLFPWLGHALHLTQHQFGVWAGVAIHDISSVVGSALAYGNEALETATAVKLSRTLWIVPLTLGLAFACGLRQRVKQHCGAAAGSQPRKPKVEIPWFIALFLVASLSRSYLPGVAEWSPHLGQIGKGGLTLALCLIGAGLSPRALRAVGWKPVLQGTLLWGFISAMSLLLILYGHAT